jgi:hypothetical protein
MAYWRVGVTFTIDVDRTGVEALDDGRGRIT